MLRRRRFLFACAVAALPGAVAAQDYGGDMPRRLVVLVRETPPDAPARIRNGRDNSYSVSTGTGGGDSVGATPDRRGADNSYSVSTDGFIGGESTGADGSTSVSVNTHVARYEVLEGEAVRVNLPSVQSLQFYAPIQASGVPSAAAGSGPQGSAAGTAPPGGYGGPGVAGVVFFEGVAAFSVRFAVQGRDVVADLLPLQIGGAAAPYGYGVQDKPRPFRIRGRLGQWIELGEPGTQTTRTLGSVPDGAPPTGVWVKVAPE